MKKKTKKTVRRDENEYIACAIEWFLDATDNMLQNSYMQEQTNDFINNNEKRVAKIDWSKVSAEKISKSLHKYLLGQINVVLGELQEPQVEALIGLEPV